jgi:hypothetical protein
MLKKMVARKYLQVLVLLCAIAAIGLRAVMAQTDNHPTFAIVVNPHVPVDDISLEELRKIFLGERQFWSSNMPVVPLIRPQGTPEREVVLRVIFKMSETEYKKYWIAKVFRAEATNEPAVAPTNAFANDAVSAIPGSIACENVKDVPHGAKVLRIDGHKPGDPGYPLR